MYNLQGQRAGRIRKCWNGNAMSYVGGEAAQETKQRGNIGRGRQRQIEKARENETSRETKRKQGEPQ